LCKIAVVFCHHSGEFIFQQDCHCAQDALVCWH